MKLRRIANVLLFTLLMPMIGVEEACREIAKGGLPEDRVFQRLYEHYRIHKSFPQYTFEAELLHAAIHLEFAGLGHAYVFERLFTMVMDWFDDMRRSIPELYTALITVIIGIALNNVVIILLTPSMPVLSLIQLVSLMVIPIIHRFQPEVFEYSYKPPLLAMAVIAPISYIISHDMLITLFVSTCAFAAFYLPQFVRNLVSWRMIGFRIRHSFQSLLYDPVPTPLRPYTALEGELSRVWELARLVGSQEFVGRVIILVDRTLYFIRTLMRGSAFYGMFIPIGYMITLVITQAFLGVMSPIGFTAIGSVPMLMPNKDVLEVMLLISAIVTSLSFGKALHSIGLGVSLMPIFLAPIIALGVS